MFKCEDCGCLFEYPKCVKESRGEFWGIPCYEDMYYCPRCGSSSYAEYEDVEEEEYDI